MTWLSDEATMVEYFLDHIRWSKKVFGEGDHTEGLLKHIEKEVQEIRAEETSEGKAKEIVDIIILAIDAMWRLGYSAEEIAHALCEKQKINYERQWPAITDPNQPTEHIRKERKDGQ